MFGDTHIIIHDCVTVKCYIWEGNVTLTQKRSLTDYGMQVKIELLKRGQTQEWLISEIQKLLPEKYVDNSNLYKILTGQINSKGITAAINEILDIS